MATSTRLLFCNSLPLSLRKPNMRFRVYTFAVLARSRPSLAMAGFLHRILFQTPSSVYINTASAASLIVGLHSGWSEATGKNLSYSKFAKQNLSGRKLQSRNGMLLCYGPALLLSSACLFLTAPASATIRLRGLAAALSLHFLKRELEVNQQITLHVFRSILFFVIADKQCKFRRKQVVFLHRYSGFMALRECVVISSSYLLSSANLLYAQQLSEAAAPPQTDLRLLGFGLYLVGLAGNFYHHSLLAGLRKEGQKQYVMPRGGLFDFVVCPHYLFEVIEWFGVACISQTVYGFVSAFNTFCYLSGRSLSTRKWYLSKFSDFPAERKAILPFIL
eukprot:TRINITY_DN1601_c0_g1_i2.p1 TRINITY_DN1601_c0_g1~~TRINITY_DN1601_c0_g1_i2.p1  ORF type:complete len:333 (+),score=19.61 TRINITY_DN1601_c0_g1_i2:66-1064(+)